MLQYALASISTLNTETPGAEQLLQTPDRLRLSTISSIKRRREFIAGRLLLRRMLSATFGVEAASWKLDCPAGQRPRLFAYPDVHLSISHSADMVAVAVASAPIGMDIEQIKPKDSVQDIARHICSDVELALLTQSHGIEQVEYFFRIWTLKEAWLKREGTGLDFDIMRRMAVQNVNLAQANAISMLNRKYDLALSIVSDHLDELVDDDFCRDSIQYRHIQICD